MALNQHISFPRLRFQNFKTKGADTGSLSLPWVLATGPANPSDESQQSLRGDLMGVSTSGVSKLPSESELPRGKNEGLPLSTVLPTAFISPVKRLTHGSRPGCLPEPTTHWSSAPIGHGRCCGLFSSILSPWIRHLPPELFSSTIYFDGILPSDTPEMKALFNRLLFSQEPFPRTLKIKMPPSPAKKKIKPVLATMPFPPGRPLATCSNSLGRGGGCGHLPSAITE